MYGTRDTAQMVQRTCSEIVRELDVVAGRASPCHFDEGTWQVCGVVHGGDFVFNGKKQDLEDIANRMAAKFKAKVAMPV